MFQIHVKNCKLHKSGGYVWIIPNGNKYAGYKTYIPRKYVTLTNTYRLINLSGNQKMKLQKDGETIILTIDEIMGSKNE